MSQVLHSKIISVGVLGYVKCGRDGGQEWYKQLLNEFAFFSVVIASYILNTCHDKPQVAF